MWNQLNNSFPSFVKLPLQSRTHWLSSFHNGMPSSKNSNSMNTSCHGMSQLTGTWHTTCSSSPLTIAWCSISSLGKGTWNYGNMSSRIWSGRSTMGYIRGIFSFKIVSSLLFNDHFVALKTHHPLFFLCNTQHCSHYPHHGPSRSTPCH